MIRAIIVEDETIALEALRQLVVGHPGVELLGDCSRGAIAVDMIRRERPQLVFLDIQLPDMNGFDVLEAIPEDERPAVIFVTAHDQYAIRSLEVRDSDYLVKPVSRERLQRSLDRAIERIEEFG